MAPLFKSREGGGAISARQANRIVRRILAAAGLDPHEAWGTHTMRKTFARGVFELSGHDLVLTRAALGHVHLSSTEKYLAADEDAAAAVIRALGEKGPANLAAKEHVCG
jgi:site-specific recombinase XerD